MTQHALGSDGEPSDALSHKGSGKEEQGKAGIPRDMLVYAGLIRGLERREAKRRRKTSQVFSGTCSSDGWPVDGEETPPSKEHSSRRRSSLLARAKTPALAGTVSATAAPFSF